MVEMLETSDGEQLLSQADKLACDHIFARFKIHITGCDSGTDMQ